MTALPAAILFSTAPSILPTLNSLHPHSLCHAQFDTDRSGALDADELKIALRQVLGDDLSIDDCDDIIKHADRDGNGGLDFQEFCFVCRGEI